MKKQISKACILMVVVAGLVLPGSVAMADDAGAFIGGMLTSRVLGNMSARTRAEQQQAQAQQKTAQQAQQPVQQVAPAPASQTKEQKLDELDKLAAGGYITPEEYKARKKAIIDG